VHAERLVHELDSFTDRQHAAQQFVRTLIWFSDRALSVNLLRRWRYRPLVGINAWLANRPVGATAPGPSRRMRVLGAA
jgi:hypothetical protein